MKKLSDTSDVKKTTVDISKAQYFFLKEKVLALQKQNVSASLGSVIRDLIEKDMKNWERKKK
jgi:hypothetical protein